MSKVKLASVAVIALLAVIVIFQNTDVVETKLLFISIQMPRVVLLVGTLLIGFVLGLLAAGRIARRRHKPE